MPRNEIITNRARRHPDIGWYFINHRGELELFNENAWECVVDDCYDGIIETITMDPKYGYERAVVRAKNPIEGIDEIELVDLEDLEVFV